MKAGFSWICQIARCCGSKYVRKRLPGRPFKCSGQRCIHCNALLAWMEPEPNRALVLAGYRSRAEKNRRIGLTAHGSPRRRRPLTEPERLYLELKLEMESKPKDLPLATGFRDFEKSERFRPKSEVAA